MAVCPKHSPKCGQNKPDHPKERMKIAEQRRQEKVEPRIKELMRDA